MADSAYYDPILKGEWVRSGDPLSGKYIHPITKAIVSRDQYLQTAYTQDAIDVRKNIQQINNPFHNL